MSDNINGVVYKKLKDVCEFKNGFAFKADKFTSNGEVVIRIGDIQGGKLSLKNVKYIDLDDYPSLEKFRILPGEILVAMSGATTGKVGYNSTEKTLYLNQRVGKFEPKKDILDERFLYHYLLSKEEYMLQLSTGVGSQPNLNKSDVDEILIPIPPIKIQKSIAETLDFFEKSVTDLQTELQTELQLRKKQYNFYRDLLLSEKYLLEATEKLMSDEKIEIVKLKDICLRQKGINTTAKEMEEKNKENGEVKVFAGGKTVAHFDLNDVGVDNIINKPSVIVKSRGNIGFEYYDKPFTHKNELWSYSSKNNDVLDIKYLYYYLSKDAQHFQNIAIPGKLPQISIGDTDEYRIYLPSIVVQRDIVNILDAFEKYTKEVEGLLPREIELRQKQYEYYRAKLFDFDKE